MHFGENFIKQKLQGTPILVGAGQFWTPKPDLKGPGPHVHLEPWSLTLKESS